MPTTVQLVKLSALEQIQTDLAATVAGSAAAALNSQNAAAASAATALNAQATEYLGAIAGTAVPATATTKGQYYLITTAGTSPNVPAINWTVGDKAVYNGTSGSWSRITGFLAASNSYAESVGATRVGSGYLYSDGATSGRGQVQVPGARGNLAGAAQASWVGWVDVPTSNPSADANIASIQGTAGVTAYASGNCLTITISGGGILYIGQQTDTSNYRYRQWSGWRAMYSGQRIWLDVRITAGTGNPSVYINGSDVSASFSDGNLGTPPNWLSGLSTTYFQTGFAWPAGIAPLGCWLNAHLTNAESDTWRITGRPPFWVFQGGAMRDYVSNFTTADTDGWGNNNANNTRTSNIDQNADGLGVPPSNDWLRISKTVSAGTTDTLRNAPRLRGIGAVNRYSGDVFVPSTFPAGLALGIRRGGLDYVVVTPLTPGTTTSFQVTTANTGTSLYDIFGICTLNGALSASVDPGVSWYLKNLVIDSGGALSLPAVQPIAVVDDVTTLGGNQARLVGMVPVCERRDWRIVAPTATNGNQQLLGGALFAEPERHRIDSWVVNNTGAATRTVSLGQSSAATTTYANAASCPVGRTEITLATRFPAAGQPNLWANSNGNDNLVHTITGHRVEA